MPRYETPQDRKNERDVFRILERKWSVKVNPAPDAAVYDATIERGGSVIGMLEVKCRKVERAKYRTIIISKKKVDQMCHIARASQTEVKCLFVVQFTDALVGIRLQPEDYDTVRGGMKGRGDPNDIELCYDIPTEWFNLIARTPQ